MGEIADHAGSRLSPFAFTKWYLDCVDDEGRIAIGYWASLAWGGLALTWHALSVTEDGRRSVHRTALAGGGMPVCESNRILWRAPTLGCVLTADALSQPIARRLFASREGFVDWRCEAPAALVTLQIGGRPPMRGTGYVERLDLTTPPWRLPISELRWGRWMDNEAAHSLVWIDWRETEPRTWVFADGVGIADASVGDDRVSGGPASLTLASRTTMASSAPRQIIDGIPALRAVVPASLLALRQTRWASEGILQRPAAAPIRGRAIHELVTFR